MNKLLIHIFFTLFVLDVFAVKQSQAKPLEIFGPIIEDIKTRIPSDLKMRLPAFVPTSIQDKTLYSFMYDDDLSIEIALDDLKMEFFTVQIADTPDCSEARNPQDCLVAIVGVAEDPIESEAQLNDLISNKKEDIDQVKFEREIEGFYFVDEDLQIIIWRQDKMANLLITQECSDKCISKQELIEMAKSAAKEPAITNIDTSYYSY